MSSTILGVGDGNSGGASATTVSVGANGNAMPACLVGDLIDVIGWGMNNTGQTGAITDTAGFVTSWTQVDHDNGASFNHEFYRWRGVVATAGTPVPQFTYGASDVLSIVATAIRGVNTTTPDNAANFVHNTQNSPASPGAGSQTSTSTPTLSVQPCIGVAYMVTLNGAANSSTPTGGWTTLGNFGASNAVMVMYQSLNALTAIAATATPPGSTPFDSFIGIYNDAAAPPFAVVATGTQQTQNYNASNTLSWSLSPTPTAGNAVVIAVTDLVCGSATVPTLAVTDNHGNTYTSIVQQQNTASATSGGTVAAFFVATNVASAGAFTVTVTGTSSSRQSFIANHMEVAGMAASGYLDATVGTYTSGASAVTSVGVTAGSANANANDIVLAVMSSSNPTNAGASGSDPPASGYTSMGHGILTGGSSGTLGGYGDIAYKTISAVETSAATWSAFANAGYAGAAIITLKPAVSGITLGLVGQSASFTAGTLIASGGTLYTLPLGFVRRPGPGISPDYNNLFLGRQRLLSTQFPPSSITLGLTGQAATFSTGLIGAAFGGNLTLALTGLQITSNAGNLLAVLGNNITLALLGQAATFSTGTLSAIQLTAVVAQALTSGTFNNGIWDTRHIIDRAYGALRLKPQQITSEMIQIALDVLGLVQQNLINTAAPLWTTQKVLITLNQGQRSYTMPNATNDVDKAYFRTMANITPATITTDGLTYYQFDFGSTNATAVSSLSVNWLNFGVPISIQSSSNGLTWQAAGKSNLTQMGAGLIWYDMEVTNAQRYWRFVPATTAPLQVVGASLYNAPSEVEMSRLNKDDYWAMPNKDFPGRPLQYWVDRQLTPTMRLWPSPDSLAAQSLMVVHRKRYLMDVGNLQQTIEVPSRWYFPIIFALAEALSWCTPEADPTICEQVRVKAGIMVREALSEERDRSPIRFQMNLSQYTR